MRTVTFQSVLHGAARLLGMNPAQDLNAAAAARVTEYVQTRYEEALAFEFWPELMAVEERTPDASKVIAYEQAGETPLGEVRAVYQRDPRATVRPSRIFHTVTADGVQLPQSAPETVWVEFRVRPNVFTSTVWASKVGGFAVGDVRYYAVTGECYLGLTAANAATPGSDGTKWEKLDFPFLFAPFVKRAAAADGLGDLKQMARKNSELAQAYADLSDAADQAMAQQGQYERIEVAGY